MVFQFLVNCACLKIMDYIYGFNLLSTQEKCAGFLCSYFCAGFLCSYFCAGFLRWIFVLDFCARIFVLVFLRSVFAMVLIV